MANEMLFLVLLISIIVGSRAQGVHSGVQVDPDGGYKNIVVKFAGAVSEENCEEIIQNLKGMFTSASKALNDATEQQVFFKNVQIVIPSHWNEESCGKSDYYNERNSNAFIKNADILITGDSPIFGDSLYTEQSGSCGEKGERILVPQGFLSRWNQSQESWGNPGKALVKEWAKLRYGVFEEHGFPGDPLYPNYYKVQNELFATGTSNTQVRGSWLTLDGEEGCEPRSGNCYYHPHGDNDDVSCSLGYLPSLGNVREWCSREQIALPLAPTKHNILCNSKPALEVIMSSPDFNGVTGRLQESLVPNLTVVREPLPQYILMIETSADMAPVWKWVRKAAQNLIRYELPDNAWIAVLTFSMEARVEHRMVQLTSESVRSRMADTIPDSPNRLGETEASCITCGVSVAMNQVLSNREAGGHLIIVSRASHSQEERSNLTLVADSLGVRISSILLGKDPQGGLFFNRLATKSGGISFTVDIDAKIMVIYSDLLEGLRKTLTVDIQDLANYPVTIYRNLLSRTDSQPTRGNFTVDTTLGRDTVFGILVEDDEDHQIKSIEFQDSRGKLYGPYHKMSSSFGLVNFKTINFNVGEESPFSQGTDSGTEWQYRIEWFPSESRRDSVVTVRSKPIGENNDLIAVKTWTSFSYGLLAVYVKVSKGDLPISGARVRVTFQAQATEPTSSSKTLPELFLVDNGYGEPDIVAYDGVYSGYLTKYPFKGYYSYFVDVDDYDETAWVTSPGKPVVSKPRVAGPNTCCGSIIPVPEERRSPTGMFYRRTSGPSVMVSFLPERIQPGKIGDLAVAVVEEKQELLATWTAPGGDYNSGEVITYRFVFSQKLDDLITPLPNAPALDGLKRNDPPGTRISHTINFKYYNQDYYVGLFAFDQEGNRGNMSNLVLVHVSSPPDLNLDSVEDGLADQHPSDQSDNTDWRAIVGGVVGSFLFLALLFLLACCFIQRRKSAKKTAEQPNQIRSRAGSVKVHIPSHAERGRQSATLRPSDKRLDSLNGSLKASGTNGLGKQPVSDTSFGNNITPTYWSASQLLSEHEQRHQKERQNHSRTMDSNSFEIISTEDEETDEANYTNSPLTVASSGLDVGLNSSQEEDGLYLPAGHHRNGSLQSHGRGVGGQLSLRGSSLASDGSQGGLGQLQHHNYINQELFPPIDVYQYPKPNLLGMQSVEHMGSTPSWSNNEPFDRPASRVGQQADVLHDRPGSRLDPPYRESLEMLDPSTLAHYAIVNKSNRF